MPFNHIALLAYSPYSIGASSYAFNCHVSLVSFNLKHFLGLLLSSVTVIILNNSCFVLRALFILDLFDVSL